MTAGSEYWKRRGLFFPRDFQTKWKWPPRKKGPQFHAQVHVSRREILAGASRSLDEYSEIPLHYANRGEVRDP